MKWRKIKNKMGYSTEFAGELRFTTELTTSQLVKLKSFLGEDCRNHPEWNRSDLTYIDLELTSNFSGLRWDGSEKTYDLTEKVNLIIEEMQKDYPEFGLEGSILAQGDDSGDRWSLIIENGKAVSREVVSKLSSIKCPHCNGEFSLQIEQ